MSKIMDVTKNEDPTIVIDLKEAYDGDTCCITLDMEGAQTLLTKLYQVLNRRDYSLPLHLPSAQLATLQTELTNLCNAAMDEHTEAPIAQSPELVWVYNENRGGNWYCGGGVYDSNRWACHNILVKYAPHVTTSMTIRLEMYDKPGPGRAAVTIHPEGPEDYQMELDNKRTDSYSELRGWITAHRDHNRVYLGVQVVADTAPCQERGPKTL